MIVRARYIRGEIGLKRIYGIIIYVQFDSGVEYAEGLPLMEESHVGTDGSRFHKNVNHFTVSERILELT